MLNVFINERILCERIKSGYYNIFFHCECTDTRDSVRSGLQTAWSCLAFLDQEERTSNVLASCIPAVLTTHLTLTYVVSVFSWRTTCLWISFLPLEMSGFSWRTTRLWISFLPRAMACCYKYSTIYQASIWINAADNALEQASSVTIGRWTEMNGVVI